MQYKKMPIGLTIFYLLAFTAVVCGVFGIPMVIVMSSLGQETAMAHQAVQMLYGWLLLIIFVIGTRYALPVGWWVGSAMEGSGFLELPSSILELVRTPMLNDAPKQLFYLIVGASVTGAILAYLFRPNVLAYFGLSHLNKRRALLILFGIALAMKIGQKAFEFIWWKRM